MKDLKYLDYELINPEEREKARDEHKEEMADVENQAANEKEVQNEVIDQDLVDARIETTLHCFKRIIDNCDEDS